MAFTRKDLGKVRWNLLLLAGSLLLSGILAFFSWYLEQQAQAAFNQQLQQSSAVRQKLLTLRRDEADMRAKIARYQELEARGIIGNEHRLDWVELLRSIEKNRKLLGLEYEIAPQQPLAASLLPGSSSSHDFMVSNMHMRLPLLHENDLLNLLADLRDNASAFVRPIECKIGRIDGNALSTRERGLSPQLSSECQIDWITLKEKQ